LQRHDRRAAAGARRSAAPRRSVWLHGQMNTNKSTTISSMRPLNKLLAWGDSSGTHLTAKCDQRRGRRFIPGMRSGLRRAPGRPMGNQSPRDDAEQRLAASARMQGSKQRERAFPGASRKRRVVADGDAAKANGVSMPRRRPPDHLLRCPPGSREIVATIGRSRR